MGLYSANQQKKSAQGAANAQQAAADAATAEQRRQFDLTRGDQAPWLQAGQGALAQMQALNSGDFGSFTQSPDYQFAFDQGLQGLDRSASARGGMFSGGADADRMKFASGLASQNYNQFYNRLQSMAGQGQTTASGLGSLGMGMANNIGNIGINMGDARASSYGQRADTNSQLAGLLGGAFNNYMQGRSQPVSTGASNYQWASTSGFGNNYGGSPYTASTLSGNGLNNSWWNS